MTAKKDGESHYWAVEQWAHELQGKVALSHAKRGGYAVLMTGRNVTEEQMDECAAAKVQVISTKRRTEE
jgi:hypothetical protein